MSHELSLVSPFLESLKGVRRLCIVGVGLIGGSIGRAAKARGIVRHVVGVETDGTTWTDALRLGTVDEITNDLATGVRDTDLVILAVSVAAILELLPRLVPLVGPNTIVTDVGSVKTAIATAGFAAFGERFIAGHPMTGSEQAGVNYARLDLFEGAAWVLTPPAPNLAATETLRAFVSALGAVPTTMSPEAHDTSVAWTSHLPHVLAYTLCAVPEAKKEIALNLAAGSWRSATRVALSSPQLWSEIAVQNAAPLSHSLRTFAEELLTIATALETEDTQKVQQQFTTGHLAKKNE